MDERARGVRNRLRSSDYNGGDDGVSLVNAEDYVNFRLEPAIADLSIGQPFRERLLNRAQFVMLFLSLGVAVLGILELRLWIAVLVAVAAAAEAIASFEQLQAHLVGTSNALNTLKTLHIWWQNLSFVERRKRENKAYLVELTEEAIEGRTIAWTQGMLRRSKAKELERVGEDTSSRNS
jgi:hypothetical protein